MCSARSSLLFLSHTLSRCAIYIKDASRWLIQCIRPDSDVVRRDRDPQKYQKKFSIILLSYKCLLRNFDDPALKAALLTDRSSDLPSPPPPRDEHKHCAAAGRPAWPIDRSTRSAADSATLLPRHPPIKDVVDRPFGVGWSQAEAE